MIQTLFGSTENKPGLFDRMKEAVSRTRQNLSERIEEVVAFSKEIDRNTLDDLEATLIAADLGSATTHQVLEKLRERADRKQIKDVGELKRLLKEELLKAEWGISSTNRRVRIYKLTAAGAKHLEHEVSRFEKMLDGITRVLAPGES